MNKSSGMFFWGAATSSHQVEGENHNDWTEWEHENSARLAAEVARSHANARMRIPEYILKNYPDPLQEENYISGRATDHYNRFRSDFDIAESLGHNAHRFSIEWSRIEPGEGKFDDKEIKHYREVIKALRERSIEPFVTIWHWTLPLWLAQRGGVLNKKFPRYFERFAEKIAVALKDDVSFWITMNEPEIYSGMSYFKGIRPPQKKNIFLLYKSIFRLMRAHRKAYKIIKAVSPQSSVGMALNIGYLESAGGPINNALKWIADRLWNFHFLNHVHEEIDFIGLNYYFHNRIDCGFNKNSSKEISDMGWEIYPKGLYHILKELKRYNLPIYITENGVADAEDKHRARFIKNHISMIEAAKQEGVDVRGYFYWSLLDNFEWGKGFWPRFGLVEIDYKTMERKIRPSALEYKKVIEADQLAKSQP